ncbi:transmembrane protein 216-like isoform X2 [Pomacea canaliculata]|nr:transmembrane protein 216-like isoform X2 [Pomacea canaliculata]
MVHSSLPYQILLYLNSWYFAFFVSCELLIFVYKGETLPFGSGVLAAEIILIFLMVGIESFRIFFGKKGNLMEQITGMVISILLSVPALFGAVFLLLWQTYVLRIEIILSGVQLALICVELIFGIISIITFARASHY